MSTAKKEALTQVEELFKENAKGYVTYEKLVKFLDKAPTAMVANKTHNLRRNRKNAKYRGRKKTTRRVSEVSRR